MQSIRLYSETGEMGAGDIALVGLLLCCLLQHCHSFVPSRTAHIPVEIRSTTTSSQSSVAKFHSTIHNRLPIVSRRRHFASSGLGSPSPQPVSQSSNWNPLKALTDNPIVRVFDGLQSLVHQSAVSTHDFLRAQGVQQAYGTTIVAMTLLAHLATAPLSFYEKKAAQTRHALSQKSEEVRRQYADKPELQRRLIDHITKEAETNSVLSFLAVYAPIPLFMALYRSVNSLVAAKAMREPFLWIPDLQGPVYDAASTDWLTKWHNFRPLLGWKDTASFLSIPALLYAAQSLSLATSAGGQSSPQPLNLLSFSLTLSSFSVPAGLGLYWFVNSALGTVSSAAVKTLVDSDPFEFDEQQLRKIVTDYNKEQRATDWGYRSEEDMFAEARRNFRPSRSPVLPMHSTQRINT